MSSPLTSGCSKVNREERRSVLAVLAAVVLGLAAVQPVLGPAPPAAADLAYTTIDVPGAVDTDVAGVNNLGVLVGSYVDATGRHGFLDDQGTVVTVDVPGSSDTRLTSVNDAGTATGAYWDAGGTTQHGFVRTAAGVFTWLDAPGIAPGDRTGTLPTGINAAGVVVGSSFTTDLDGFTYPDETVGEATSYHGFVWKAGQFTTYQAPDTSDSGPPVAGTRLTGINKAGTVVGTAYYPAGDLPNRGFVLSGTTVRPFVDPTVPTGFCGYTEPSAVNDLGVIAGNSGNGCAPTSHVFLLTGSQFTFLGYPGAAQTRLGGVTNGGLVAGTWTDGSGTDHGFTVLVPAATVTGTVGASGPAYPKTVYGVRACPSSQPFGPGCADGSLVTVGTTGRYELTLAPGTWVLAGFAWSGGDPAQETLSPTVTLTLAQGQSARSSFVVPSQAASFSAKVNAGAPWPNGTLFGALGCPANQDFGLACPDGVTVQNDASGSFTLTVAAGTWNVAALAWPGGTSDVVVGQPVQVQLVAGMGVRQGGPGLTVLSPYGQISGSVYATGPVPQNTVFGALACPAGQAPVVGCPFGVTATTDSTGRYLLVLHAGSWNVLGLVTPPGAGGPLTSSPVSLTLGARQSITMNLTVSTPFGAVSGSVNPVGAFPAGTTFGTMACRTTESFGWSCPSLATATAGTRNQFVLALTPGTWNVAAFAWTGIGGQRVVGSLVTRSVTTGQFVPANLPVVSPFAVVSGTVTPGGPFPNGSTYVALACPPGQPFGPGCTSAVTAPTDRKGAYVLALLPGTWQVGGVAYTGGPPVVSAPQTVTASTGAAATASFVVRAPTYVVLSSSNGGRAGSPVGVSATLQTFGGVGVSGATLQFTLGSASCSGVTGRSGSTGCTLTPTGPPRTDVLGVTFAGDAGYSGSSAWAPFAIR
jgi:hypothetical protein